MVHINVDNFYIGEWSWHYDRGENCWKLLVKKLEEPEAVTSSGLFVVNNEKNDVTKKALVVAVGTGKIQNGQRIPIDVNEGDTVIYNGMYGTDIGSFHTSNSNDYMILHVEDVIAVVTS